MQAVKVIQLQQENDKADQHHQNLGHQKGAAHVPAFRIHGDERPDDANRRHQGNRHKTRPEGGLGDLPGQPAKPDLLHPCAEKRQGVGHKINDKGANGQGIHGGGSHPNLGQMSIMTHKGPS